MATILTERQKATIEAALRYWKRNVLDDYGKDELAELPEWPIANEKGRALEGDAIEVLIERVTK